MGMTNTFTKKNNNSLTESYAIVECARICFMLKEETVCCRRHRQSYFVKYRFSRRYYDGNDEL